ncbi:MAG: hypothetical protein ACD_39C00698G0001 [uncultured bacterium]|nr:MAG: hypothetical protein ACD_39C00698G0001 [uncultured bacterium]
METGNENTNESQNNAPELQIDPIKWQAFKNDLEGQQNLPLGLIAGMAAAVIGAIIWAAVTVITKYQIGWLAIGLGALVGLTVGKFGKGIHPTYGVLGAVLALASCILGNLLSVCGFLAQQEAVSFFEVASSLITQPSAAWTVLKATFDPRDLLFYGIAMYAGYTYAFRQITPEEVAALVEENNNTTS